MPYLLESKRVVIFQRPTSASQTTHTEWLCQMALAVRAGLWSAHILIWRGTCCGEVGGKLKKHIFAASGPIPVAPTAFVTNKVYLFVLLCLS